MTTSQHYVVAAAQLQIHIQDMCAEVFVIHSHTSMLQMLRSEKMDVVGFSFIFSAQIEIA